MMAARRGDLGSISDLLRHDSGSEHTDKTNADGRTALLLATEAMEDCADVYSREKYRKCVEALRSAAGRTT